MSIFSDSRWEAYGMLREAYLAVTSQVDAVVSPGTAIEPAISDLLFRLARTPGHVLRTTDITHALSTSSTRTTRLVDEVERRRWVERLDDPSDRRAVLVSLTAEGLSEATRRGTAGLEAAQRFVYDVLDDGEVTAMIAALRKLRDANLRTT